MITTRFLNNLHQTCSKLNDWKQDNFFDRGLLLKWKLRNPGLRWRHLFESFTVATITWLTVTEYMCHKWGQICSICRKIFPSFPHSWLTTGFVIRVTRRVTLVDRELLTLPEHMSSPPVFSRVRVARSLVFCVVFCRSLFVLLSVFFWPLCCLSSYDLRILITIWYLQTLLESNQTSTTTRISKTRQLSEVC